VARSTETTPLELDCASCGTLTGSVLTGEELLVPGTRNSLMSRQIKIIVLSNILVREFYKSRRIKYLAYDFVHFIKFSLFDIAAKLI